METVSELNAQPHTKQGSPGTEVNLVLFSPVDQLAPKQDDEETRVVAFISEGNPNASDIE